MRIKEKSLEEIIKLIGEVGKLMPFYLQSSNCEFKNNNSCWGCQHKKECKYK